jgi:hypothetical protein
MKKIIAMIMVVALVAVMFAGCGNMSMGFGNFTFEKIHVDTYHYSGCFTVEKWYDNSNGIEVKTKEAGFMYLAEGMYMLIEDECPFCSAKE